MRPSRFYIGPVVPPVGPVTVTLSGTLDAQAAGITGNVTVEGTITLSGIVDSQAAGITGAVEREITASGTITSQAAGITGDVTISTGGPIILGRAIVTITP